jgi:hypothetical protein
VTPVRLVAAIVLTVLSAIAAQAEPIVHRSAVAAGEAVPTGGSFSVLFPIAFNDVEIRAEDPPAPTLVTHLLMGLNSEGLRVSAIGPEIYDADRRSDGGRQSSTWHDRFRHKPRADG